MATGQAKKNRKPISEGYFTWPSDDPRLIASKCNSCKTYYFPKPMVCQNPECKNTQLEEVTLSRKGKLWSYTYAFNPPPAPFRMEPFVPYGVGLIELPEGIRVLGMLTSCSLDELKVGLELELVIDPLYEDQLGNEFVTWKFKPIH